MDELRQREPRVEDEAFLAFVRTRRCAACGAPPPNHAAHVAMACPERGKRATGFGEKASDRHCVPLCRSCHQDGPQAQHKGSEAAFWRRVGINPFVIAAALYAEFEASHHVEPASKNRIRIKNPRKAGSRNFIFSTDKSKPKRKWPKRQLHGTMKFPKGRKIARRR